MAKNKRYIEMLKWIWLVACFSALVISVACWLPSMVDSDMASEMVLAKLIQEEGHFEFQISCIEHKGLRYVLFITFFCCFSYSSINGILFNSSSCQIYLAVGR